MPEVVAGGRFARHSMSLALSLCVSLSYSLSLLCLAVASVNTHRTRWPTPTPTQTRSYIHLCTQMYNLPTATSSLPPSLFYLPDGVAFLLPPASTLPGPSPTTRRYTDTELHHYYLALAWYLSYYRRSLNFAKAARRSRTSNEYNIDASAKLSRWHRSRSRRC